MPTAGKGRAAGTTSVYPCYLPHQVAALALVAATFLITRAFFSPCPSPPPAAVAFAFAFAFASGGGGGGIDVTAAGMSWPSRVYGTRLDLKIYVYEESEIDGLGALMRGREGRISPDSCIKGQWGTQVKIYRLLLKSMFRTMKKGEANLFFVPSYFKCVRMMGGLNDKEINQTCVKVLSQMPYFCRSGGRDHIFVFPSGAGAHLFRSWATYLNRSTILTPEGDRTDKRDTSAFNTWKDIIIPGNVYDGMTRFDSEATVQILPMSNRKYLANFLGRPQGKLESPELKFSGPDKSGRIEYFQHLRNAKFCLAPRGESSWTLRFYESFFVECVPVILSDQVELPFQNVIDYTQISIKWPATRIGPELLDYLQSIPDEEIDELIARGRRVKCMWVYAAETEPCSAMLGIVGTAAKSEALPPISRDILATQWVYCKPKRA